MADWPLVHVSADDVAQASSLPPVRTGRMPAVDAANAGRMPAVDATNAGRMPALHVIRDPARFPWHEVTKVAHYWLEVNAMTRPMQVTEKAPDYGGQR